MKITLFVAVALTFPTISFARSSDACFSKEEVATMFAKRDELAKASSDCLKAYRDTHLKFYATHHYSKYFGNRNPDLDTADKRARSILTVLWPDLISSGDMQRFKEAFSATAGVDANGKKIRPGLSDLEKYMAANMRSTYSQYMTRKDSLHLMERAAEERGSERGQVDLRASNSEKLQNFSCVDMGRRCLQAGFQAIGMGDTFKKIDAQVLEHGVSGVEMQKGLSDLGWRILYFNPDTSQNQAWDEEDKKINPLAPGKVWMGSWGGHWDSWNLFCNPDNSIRAGKTRGGVRCSDAYMVGAERPVPVDDKRLLVDFRTTVPAAFKAVPFFVGTAHGGYHVFPGYSGNIIEAHSMRALSSENNLEVSFFNPIDQENHGGPRWTDVEHYRTGVIAVPPGYLDHGELLRNPQVDSQGCVDLRPGRGR